MFVDDDVMKQLLRETPQGLIKFQMYSKKDEQRFTDRRLNRIKNKNTIPLGPWAHTVIEGTINLTSIIGVPIITKVKQEGIIPSHPPFIFRSKDSKLHDDFDYHKFHCFRSPGR